MVFCCPLPSLSQRKGNELRPQSKTLSWTGWTLGRSGVRVHSRAWILVRRRTQDTRRIPLFLPPPLLPPTVIQMCLAQDTHRTRRHRCTTGHSAKTAYVLCTRDTETFFPISPISPIYFVFLVRPGTYIVHLFLAVSGCTSGESRISPFLFWDRGQQAQAHWWLAVHSSTEGIVGQFGRATVLPSVVMPSQTGHASCMNKKRSWE